MEARFLSLIFLYAFALNDVLSQTLASRKCTYFSCECIKFSSADVTTLLDLKTHVTSDPHGALSDWKSSRNCKNGWSGVCCDKTGRISEIVLGSMQLVGSVPSSIGKLTGLRSLDLSFNNFGGTIPTSIGQLPILNFLYLNNNVFGGSIPVASGSFKSLIALELSKNSLKGTIPSTIGSIKKILQISISNNQISGSIPAALSSLINLNYLDLSSNRLTGSIPSTLGKLSNLVDLFLDNNYLSGAIPSTLGSLNSSEAGLTLNNNYLNGKVPSALSKYCANANLVDLRENYLQPAGAADCSIGPQRSAAICSAFYYGHVMPNPSALSSEFTLPQKKSLAKPFPMP